VKALAWFPETAAESAPLVRQLVHDRPPAEELANAILCLGILDRYLQDLSDVPWLQGRLQPSEPSVVRVTAAISLAVLLGQALPAEALGVLLEAIQDVRGDEPEQSVQAWHMGGLSSHVCKVIQSLGLGPTEPVVSALCRAAEGEKTWASLNIWDT